MLGQILDIVNAFCHITVIEDWIYYVVFSLAALFAPIIALLILLYDHTSGWILV